MHHLSGFNSRDQLRMLAAAAAGADLRQMNPSGRLWGGALSLASLWLLAYQGSVLAALAPM